MPFFKPKVFSEKQEARRKEIQAKGRQHYIFYRFVLGVGLPMFALNTLWIWYDKYGFHLPEARPVLFLGLLLWLALWSVLGYVAGAIVWKDSFKNDGP